jgi:phytoene dehydrogenase-like protein
MHLPDQRFDAIVIGGGHNGLVAAAYLARGGKRVVLLEASDRLGGALATGEISPDYRVSTTAHLVAALPRRIEKDLKLAKHGLRFAARSMPTIALSRDKKHVLLSTRRKDLAALRHWNAKDAEAYVALAARLNSYAETIAPLVEGAAPLPGGDAQSIFRRLFWRAQWLGPEALEALLQELPGSIGDLVDGIFETEALKAAIAFEAIVGSPDNPFDPGTAFRLVYRKAMRLEAAGNSIPEGGMGALVEALARAAESAGAVLRTSSPVACVLVERGTVRGVELATGEVIEASTVLSAADPRLTMLDLVGAEHLDAGLARRLSRIGTGGATAKLNLALDGLPNFHGLAPAEYGARLLVVPSLAELSDAQIRFKRGEIAHEPIMEITVPSAVDATLAPQGQHVMSILVQYVPHEGEGGSLAQRDRLPSRVVDTLSLYAPDLKHRIVAGELLLPADIAARFGLADGDWYHGAMRPDQLLMFRPTPELAGMKTPLRGLYLCGAGSHPGGGISGMPGRLAAALALDEGRRA